MYSDIFCKVYNVLGWNVYPEVFGGQLLQWLENRKFRPESALDLACGTGVLCRILAENGIRTWGMDYSEGMIGIARESGGDIRYDVADMVHYRPDARFDLVTCTGDAVNHIPDLGDVGRIFENVYHLLNPGGYFVFDLLNRREISDSEPFELDFTDRMRVWFQMTRPGEDRVNLCIRVYEDGGLTLEEHIRETVHEPEEICALLRKVGFRVCRCSDRLLEDANSGTTWFLVAQKPN